FTLRGCHVQATPVTSGYSGINLVKTTAVDENCRNNDFGTFEDNLLDGGYIALYLGGTNSVSLTRERGLVVRGNVINEAGSKGIYVYDENDALIENNTVYQSLVQKTGYWGLDLARLRGTCVVRGNKVTSATTYYSGGIQLRGESYGTAQTPILVYNNVVNITASPNTSSAGIQIDGDQKFIELYNNTVRIAGTGGYCYYTARRSNASYEGIKLQNNLLQNTTTSPAMFIHADYNGKAQMVNNAFWGETVLDGTTVDALNALEGNSGNVAEQAHFLSDTDLHLMEVGNLNMGLPVDFILTDADGKQRNVEAPTVGAYEFAEIVEEKPEIVEGYPTVGGITETSANVVSKWTVGGRLHYLVVAAADEAPSAEALKAATSVDITADAEKSIALSNLDPSTEYVVYLLAVSALDVESDIVAT
ncbi:MAG: right-handed parallel beta-helix repeat-containing protein, partial [Muribaculaceae bacterium]|nr:right-handed parallel beta-helix repeat-containing protein [Muribaculaceae bacterium]